ncbi:MAG: VanZ family protein [Planctomycetota bacterium]|jgi:VanZ family protein
MKNDIMKKISSFLPPIFLMMLIFISSSIPMPEDMGQLRFLTELNPKIQNLLHIPLFGLLAYLWLNSLMAAGYPILNAIILSLTITILFGCVDEIYQTLIPGRYGSLTDLAFNFIGIILGTIVFYLLRSNKLGKGYKAGTP